MMTTTIKLSEQERIHLALSHELRCAMLRALGSERSPGDLAVTLKRSLGVVSYHMRMLRDYGMVTLVRTERARAVAGSAG
jgi:DNA-binding transcriptional ArsR family regulator